jgi:hypothetical protein
MSPKSAHPAISHNTTNTLSGLAFISFDERNVDLYALFIHINREYQQGQNEMTSSHITGPDNLHNTVKTNSRALFEPLIFTRLVKKFIAS